MVAEIAFPVEFHIVGTPISLQASPRSRERWKAMVAEGAKRRLPAHPWATDVAIAVTVYHFPAGPPWVDLDNIVKPILDALGRLVYRDDKQVYRLLVERFGGYGSERFPSISTELSAALAGPRPSVYVRIDDEWSRTVP